MSLIGTGNPVGRPSGIKDVSSDKDNSVIQEMRRRFEHSRDATEENRNSYIQNVKISASADQWDDEVKKRRGSARPALTFNLLNLIVKQIIGDYRQNKLAIKVLPAGSSASEDVADILAGLIRNIEIDSNADQAYTNALECSARGGFGYYRVVTEYEGDDEFNQKLLIKPIHNPLTVYFDPSAKLLSRADARYCLVTEMISKDEFRRQYPKAEEFGWDIVDVDSDEEGVWGDGEQIRICEYFTKELVEVRLVAFDSGAVVQIDDDSELEALQQIGWNPVKERTADRINIRWRKCNGSHILEERTYKTKYIPIIPVLGEEVNIEGKTHLRGAIYYAIDAQNSYNYERSTAIERSALSAKAPWMVTHHQIEMYRDQWDNANTTPQPYLVHTPDPQMPNGPQRIEPPAPSGADMQNSQAAAQDIQRTTGVFDAQLGEKTNVISGRGLSEQQSQGVTSTYLFVDNLRASIEHCGRILIDWIPQVYDKERVIRTISAEEDIDMQPINQQQANPMMGITEVLNDITIGKYDVIVEAGKAFASRRKEAVEGMMQFAQAFPQQAPIIADLMIDNMDVPGGSVMAARIKRSLPPQVVNDPDSPEGQQAAQQAQQKQQQAEQLQQQLISSKIQTEQGKNDAAQSKSHAEIVKAQAEVIKAHADVQQTAIETHQKHIEAVAPMEGAVSGASAQPAQAMTSGLRTNYGSRKADFEMASKKEEQDMKDAQDIKQGLGAIAQHLAQTHEGGVNQNNQLTNLLAQMIQSHQHVAKALEQQNQIASTPDEIVRDKMGKAIGKRKVKYAPN